MAELTCGVAASEPRCPGSGVSGPETGETRDTRHRTTRPMNAGVRSTETLQHLGRCAFATDTAAHGLSQAPALQRWGAVKTMLGSQGLRFVAKNWSYFSFILVRSGFIESSTFVTGVSGLLPPSSQTLTDRIYHGRGLTELCAVRPGRARTRANNTASVLLRPRR